MGQIPRETIERILDENDIVDVVGAYFPLKRQGTRMVALCPFHNEKSPSFGVNPQRQIFHCFGCGAGGDAIKFVQQYENLSFVEAVKKLADRVGIPIVEEAYDAKEEASRRFRRELQTLQRKAAEWYHRLLMRSPQAQDAREYLKSRGFNSEIAKRWLFGYAPEDSRITMDWGQQEGFTVKHLIEGGLAQWRDENNQSRGAYARFRHRLMFPINNDFGEPIAFSGRLLSAEQKGGKYVNSPETVLFNKSKTLFGIDRSKRTISRENRAVVVEGQLDMISTFEAGIENVVGGQGTALTEQHARLLKRQVGDSGEVVLCYDADSAGYNATVKGFRVLASEGLLVRVASLPPGEDPDSLIRTRGLEAMRDLIANAPEFFDFQIDKVGGTRNLDSLRDRLAFVRELTENIAYVDDKMLQDSLIKRVTTRLGVGEEEVRRLVAESKSAVLRMERNQRRRDATDLNRQKQQSAAQSAPAGNVSPPVNGNQPNLSSNPPLLTNRSIRMLCHMIVANREVKAHLAQNPPPDFLKDLPDTELLTRLWTAHFDPASNASVSSFTATLSPAEQDAVAGLRAEALPSASLAMAEDCIRALHRKAIQNRIGGIRAKLNAPHLDSATMENLSKELLDLTKRLNDIPALSSDGS